MFVLDGSLSHIFSIQRLKINAFFLKSWLISERCFGTVSPRCQTPDQHNQKSPLKLTSIIWLVTKWLMTWRLHTGTGPERDKDGGENMRKNDSILLESIFFPQNNQDKWFVIVTQDKEFQYNRVDYGKNAASMVNHSMGKNKKETVQNGCLWR